MSQGSKWELKVWRDPPPLLAHNSVSWAWAHASWDNAGADVPSSDWTTRRGERGIEGSALASRFSLGCSLLRTAIRAQPQRDVGGLHRLGYHSYQIVI